MILFKGLIAPCDVPTGDGRMFAPGKMTHRPLPLPVMAKFGAGSHDGGVPVAKINNIFPGPGGYWGEGNFLDPVHVPEVPRSIYMVQEKVLGPSVDLDRDFTIKVVPHPSRPDKKATLFEEYNVIGMTLVPMPAFYQVHMSVESSEEKSLLASAGVDVSRFLDPDEYRATAGAELWIRGEPLLQMNEMEVVQIMADTAPVTAPDMSYMVVANGLQVLLAKLTRLYLELKHCHWNVVGPQFIAIHKMLDKMAQMAADETDQVAERIAALGGSPDGTLKCLVMTLGIEQPEYPQGKADTQVYLAYLDKCFSEVIAKERELITQTGELDLVTQDLLTGQAQELEKNRWFIRAHLEHGQRPEINTY